MKSPPFGKKVVTKQSAETQLRPSEIAAGFLGLRQRRKKQTACQTVKGQN
jgi:hypothetical protein